MDKITKNSQRLLNMINSLLDLAKIEAGKIDLTVSEVALKDILNNISDTIHPLAQINHNTFTIERQDNVQLFTVDKEKLEQVLLNLLSNACKFSKNSLVTLATENTDQAIIFKINDNGIGLTSEQQKYIFDEFRQVDSSESRQFSGTGLGLAISKRFVELMNGQITVQSELGEGATFIVTLALNNATTDE